MDACCNMKDKQGEPKPKGFKRVSIEINIK